MSKTWLVNVIKLEFSIDDGSIYDLRSADMLNSYGYNATFYIPVNWQRYLTRKGIDPLAWEDVIDIANHFNIGSHGINHELLTQTSPASQDKEIFESKAWWQEHGYTVDSFCYPRGYYDDDIKDKVKKAGYKTARTVKVGNLEPPTDPYAIETTVHIGYDRDEYNTDWYSYAKKKVAEAIAKDQAGEDVYYHAWWHSEEVHRHQQWERLGNFLRHLNENLPTE